MLRKLSIILTVLLAGIFILYTANAGIQKGGGKSTLAEGFKKPPLEARPRAYWVWMNGNYSLPQITRDLEEAKDKGMSGLDIFDIGARDPEGIVPAGPAFLGEEYIEAIAHAMREAKRLDLYLGLVASSSWNAGGSWVTPEYASMLMYPSEIVVTGPSRLSQKLPFPEVDKKTPLGPDGLPVYYKDIAVIAVPQGEGRVIEDYSKIIILTSQLDKEGKLTWDVPEGKWKIIRLICANSGQKLVLPSPNSGGYNIDHFNPDATEMHFNYIIDRFLKEIDTFEGSALRFMYLCSYELRGLVGTPNILEEFKKRRKYDMTPYLPVLFGYTVKNEDITERFRYDFNMTMSDLIIENHYLKAKEVLNKHGLKLCSEAGGPGQPLHNCPFEALRALGSLDIPRGEFWNRNQFLDKDGIDVLWLVKEIACASHIYGKKIVDGEAFTSWLHWQEGPFDLKPLADRAMCGGLNLFTFHTWATNPPEAGKPGFAYHAGTHINVNRVWWPKAKPFMDYLARCCYLLQEGLFVGDVLYYYGDAAPNFVKPRHVNPELGYGYDYDVTNAEVILTRMDVKNGKIVLPDGMSYEVLVMPDRKDANPQVLTKIRELIEKGATVVGAKPTRANGLTEYPNRDKQVKKIAGELWGDCDGKNVKERAVGKGKLICGRTLKEILAEKGIGADFGFTSSLKDTELDYIHRRTDKEDVYFIYNKKMRWEEVDCTFRIKNKLPELWLPDTGEMKKIPLFDSVEGGTKVALRLPPGGSVFVVFRERSRNNIAAFSKDGESIFPVSSRVPGDVPAAEVRSTADNIELLAWEKGTYVIKTGNGKEEKVTVKSVPEDILITGSWKVKFPANWGAPPSAVFPELMSWTKHTDDGIKYFSGIARYHKEFEIPAGIVNSGSHIELDLGKVGLIADVYLNGRHLGILWKEPYRVDITAAAKSGKNRLVVEVANTWSNRLVGDSNLPKDRRYTITNIQGPKTSGLQWKDAPLIESGLLGPVRVLTAEIIKLEI